MGPFLSWIAHSANWINAKGVKIDFNLFEFIYYKSYISKKAKQAKILWSSLFLSVWYILLKEY